VHRKTLAITPPAVFWVSSRPNLSKFHPNQAISDAGHNVTFLLRNPSCFDADEKIQRHIKEGRAYLVKGDALVLDDVKRGWEEAKAHSSNGEVDFCVCSVGK
jgi:hypothetical protein